MCARSILDQVRAYVSLLAPEKTGHTAFATEGRLPRTYYMEYLSLRIRTSDSSQSEKKRNKEKKRKEDKGKERREKKRK